MRNIAIIVLSVALAAAIISGLILYQRHLDTKNSLLISEKSLSELNEKVTQLNKETSALQDQIRTNAKQLMELKSAKEYTSKLENAIKLKDQRLSEFKETLQGSQSHIRYLEEEVAKGHNEIQELQSQFINLKGQKALAETKKGKLKSIYEALISDLKKQIENQEVTIKAFKDQISVTFVDWILFEFGKATITPEGGKILKNVGEILKNIQGKQIRIVGHTDNIPIMQEYRYKFPSNWELSAGRSSAVIRYFQKNIHLDPRNLEAVGRSFYEPIDSNETSEGRAQNRRVEIIISPKLK
jgi:chemotaxis protein MotB